MSVGARITEEFYRRDVLEVAPDLLGAVICHRVGSEVLRGRVTEVEAYRGQEDTACHARAGLTRRTQPLYMAGGHAYVYLCYGIHRLFNVVTGGEGEPQAALIRGLEGWPGPGRWTKAFSISLDDNRADLARSPDLWIESDGWTPPEIRTSPRVGIDYASPEDRERPWRFTAAGTAPPPPPGRP
ncbi:MAG: DNA-3-methyladenine glycosylase [Propionibacteriaceae bacterium]|nr:DNA-3-methyladenine glycosylase [Propionibacteriaceae bacterium]